MHAYMPIALSTLDSIGVLNGLRLMKQSQPAVPQVEMYRSEARWYTRFSRTHLHKHRRPAWQLIVDTGQENDHIS